MDTLINVARLTTYDTALKSYINSVTSNSSGTSIKAQVDAALATAKKTCS